MSDSTDSSFVRELHDNFSEYPFVDLWRDRQRIIAEPSAALRPGALRTPPMRFALGLGVVPLIVAGWLMAQLAALLVVDPAPPTPEAATLFAAELREPLRDVDPARLREQRSGYRELPAPLRDLIRTGDDAIDDLPERDPQAAQAAARQWLAELELATATAEQKRTAHARLLHQAHAKARIDALGQEILASFMQGGLLADIGFAVSILISARMFRRWIRRDPRFIHAARADRFFLYYYTSRMFWWTIALIPVYGAIAFAHAADRPELMNHSDTAQWVLTAGSILYLLLYSGAMARALSGQATVDFRAQFSVAWRLLTSMAISFVLTLVVVGFVVAGPLIAYAAWLLR